MPRPPRCKRVAFDSSGLYYKPRGVPLRELDEEDVLVEEFEAMRLVDLEGLTQEESADKMGVSQPSVNRLLTSARKKVASALVNRHALHVHGGNYMIPERKFVCYECKHEWGVPFGDPRPAHCPKCESMNLHRHPSERGVGGWGGGMGGGQRGRGRRGRRGRSQS